MEHNLTKKSCSTSLIIGRLTIFKEKMPVPALETTYPNRRIFITGGGSGLGKSLALLAAEKGWSIGLTDVHEEALRQTATELSLWNIPVYTYCFDVADKACYSRHFQDFVSTTGGIDVIINNAGVGDGSPFADYSLENWEWIIGINQMGVLYGCHWAVQQMKKQGLGCIINIASAAAIAQLPEMSMYNMTKSAVRSLSETLYAELKPQGIHVLCVMPTFFQTNIMQYARGGDEARERGEKMVSQSSLTAKIMAEKIWQAAEKKQPYLVYPTDAQRVFRLSRWFPEFFLRAKAWLYARPQWQDRLLKKGR